MFNDNFRYEPSESEAKAANKSYVFQKGSLFIPTYGSYDSRMVLAPYMVLKPFSVEQVVAEFSGQLEMHSIELEDEVGKIVTLMVGAGYITRVVESAAYDFGGYRFLGDPIREIKPSIDAECRLSDQFNTILSRHGMKSIFSDADSVMLAKVGGGRPTKSELDAVLADLMAGGPENNARTPIDELFLTKSKQMAEKKYFHDTTLRTVSISDDTKEALLACIKRGEDIVMTYEQVNEAIRKHTTDFGGESIRIEGYAVVKNGDEVRIVGILNIQSSIGDPVFQIQLFNGEIMPEEPLQYCSVRIFHKCGLYNR